MNRFAPILALLVLSFAAGCGDPAGDGQPTPDATPDAVSDAADATPDAQPDAGADAASDAGEDVAPDGTPDAAADATPDSAPDAIVDAGPDTVFDPDIGGGGDTTVTPGGPLAIYAVNPTRGPVEGGTAILILGEGFTPDTEILINGRRVDGFDFVDEETVLARTPANAAGTWDLKATNGGADAVLEDAFTYVSALELGRIEPAAGPTRGGLPVTLYGAGFTDDAVVAVDGRLGIDIRVVDSARIEFVMPPGEAGPADVRVTSANGSAVLTDAFAYYADVSLSAVEPAAGDAAGGYTVTVRGTAFDAATRFFIGERAAAASLVDASTVRLTVPSGSPGFADVRAEPEGRLGDTLVDGFFYVNGTGDDGIDGVLPSRGPASGGTRVTIAGRGLQDATSVRFGTADASIVTRTPRMVVVTAPAGAADTTVDIQVETPDATFTAADAFTWERDLEIDSVDPAEGPIEGGTTVQVRGDGFTEATLVRFGAVGARSVEFVSPTRLNVVAPPNTLGLVDVTVRDGAREAVAGGAYRYTTAASVGSMSPTRGSMAGNTYVIVRGAGFDDDTTVTFDGIPAPSVEVLDAATLAVRTPPHAPGSVPVVVNVGGEDLELRERYTFFNPFSDALGWWGDAVNGAVNVTVIDITTGEFIEGAFVTLHIRAADARFTGVTDVNGQVTISHPDIVGPQTVSASALGYSSVTVTNVDAENVVIALASPPPISPGGGGESWPIIQGTLTGLDKITDPGPDEVLLAVIRNTTEYPGGQNPPGTGYTEVAYTDGETEFPYSLPVRPGDMAVVAICGVFNEVSGEFTPLYMGVARRIFTRMGEVLTIDIDCDISMDQSIDYKFVNPPRGPGGPEINQAIPFLDFGAEGGIDLLTVVEGTAEIITGTNLAPLDEPALEGVTYFTIGETVPLAANLPFSTWYSRDVRDPDELITFGPFLPPAQLRYPAAPGRNLVDRRFEWTLDTEVRADFYYAYIMDLAQETVFWEVWLPGDEAAFNLPYFPPGSPVADLPAGPLVFIVLSIDAISFDYDAFEFNDFSSANWYGYSANGWVIYN